MVVFLAVLRSASVSVNKEAFKAVTKMGLDTYRANASEARM